VTTFIYSAIANLLTLQITRAFVKSFSVCCVFTSRSLVTVSNMGILQLHRSSLPFTDSLTTDYTVRVTLRPISPSCRQTPLDSRPVIFFQLNACGHSPFVASSLTRGWVCRLQLLLVLASAVTLRSESHGTHGYILLSQIRDSPNLERDVAVFIFPRNRVAPGSRFPFHRLL
jgi:hypothetical protein